MAPCFTLMEKCVIHFILFWIGSPQGEGVFCSSSSISNMYALISARFKCDSEVKKKGLFGLRPFVIFTSEESHESFIKSAHWVGIGTDNLIKIKTDEFGRMIPEELTKEIQNTISKRKKPLIVNVTCGTPLLGAFDDLKTISRVCKRFNIWMHVDASLGGFVLLSQKHRRLIKEIGKADSVTFSLDKTLGVPLNCLMFLVKEKGLLNACAITHNVTSDVFKFWLMLQSHGTQKISHMIDQTFACAHYLAGRIRANDGFRLVVNSFDFTNVCFWYVPIKFRNVKEENDEWWDSIYKIVLEIKKKMPIAGNLMIGVGSLPNKNIGNFFRVVVTTHCRPTTERMDFILKEIERLGENEQ